MDLRIRKYVLYRVQNREKNMRFLEELKRIREDLRKDVIEESPNYMDGQPRGKGGTSDVTQRKALKLVDIDRRINNLEKELSAIKVVEKKIDNMGELAKEVYIETIKKPCTDLTAKAQLMHMGRRQLIQAKARLLEMFAIELGEYVDVNDFKTN